MSSRASIGARLAGILLAPLLTLARASAQQEGPRLLLGPTLGIERGVELGSIGVFTGSDECGVFTRGTVAGARGGARLELRRLAGDIGITCDLGLSITSGRFATPPATTPVFDREMADTVLLERAYRLDSRVDAALVELRGTWSPLERLRLSAGPTLGYRFNATFTERDAIVSSELSFAGGARDSVMPDGARLRPARLALGVVAGLSYELEPWPRRHLDIDLSIRADPFSPARDVAWRRFTLGVGLALLFDISSSTEPSPLVAARAPLPDPPVPPPPDVPPSAPSRAPRLAASIEIFGVDRSERKLPAAVVHVTEVAYRRHVPILPAIFFDAGSSLIALRYAAEPAGGMDRFTTDSLAPLGLLPTYHQTLNILGRRMREHPEASIAIAGSTSRDEPQRLAIERAEAVRGYLRERWGIDTSRVRIARRGRMPRSAEGTEDGRAENRRVELLPEGADLLGPVVTERTARTFDPPLIRLEPMFDAEAGVRSWELTVSQAGRTIARYASDAPGPEQPEISWRLVREQLDSVLSPIEAQLIVSDSAGGRVTARDEVPLHLERRVRVIDGSGGAADERATYTLVAFDYDSPELGKENREMIARIAEAARGGARITVTGYTDRIGGEAHNAGLSRQRAERVAAALHDALRSLLHGASGSASGSAPHPSGGRGASIDTRITVEGAGRETERFPNDLPEGRILSRAVQITIEPSTDDKGTGGE